MSVVERYTDKQGGKFCQGKGHPDACTSEKKRKQKDKGYDQDTAPKKTKKESLCGSGDGLKVTDEDHIQTEKQEAREINSDGGGSEREDSPAWIQKNIGKKIRHS